MNQTNPDLGQGIINLQNAKGGREKERERGDGVCVGVVGLVGEGRGGWEEKKEVYL